MTALAPSTAWGVRRTAQVGGGRVLEIRCVEPSDLDGLRMLYESLDDEARCLRFFSMYRPQRLFFERLVTVASRGGVGLTAVAIESSGAERIVGEGSVERLANGNGEFALTIDRSWRGWLGPYLLDALAEEAASHGMPNLEAEILTRNRPMLALVRARGYAVVPTDDWTEIHIVIGAAQRFPTWTARGEGTRVLVEGPGSAHWNRRPDFPGGRATVLACAGPGGHLRCPPLSGDPCPLAAAADVIVMLRPPKSEEWTTVRDAHPLLHRGVPVRVDDARRQPA